MPSPALVRQSTRPDATDLLDQLRKRQVTSKELVQDSLHRIEKSHPFINAAVHIFEDEALKQAARPRRGPLSGLPISIKETFGIAGQSITAGSKRMPPQVVDKDCEIVRKLREAGAIIVTRSNIPEFAMSHETGNLLYGRTNSPLNRRHTCGGSSGGEAALVGSYNVAFGVGSDIGGSIRYPAQCCGVVGFKPSSEAVDGTGTFPEVNGVTKSWLAWGPITRSVRDARLVYDVIARQKLPKAKSPRGLRLLLPEQFNVSIRNKYVASSLQNAKHALVDAGLALEKVKVPDAGKIYLHFVALIVNDFEESMKQLLVTANGQEFSKLSELFHLAIRRPTVWPGLFMTLLGMPIVRPSARRVSKTVDYVNQVREKYYEMLGDDGVFLLPTSGDVALRHGKAVAIDNRPGVQGVFTPTVFCNLLDLPSISIPAWTDVDTRTSLPPGIMLASAPGKEAILLDAAAALEERISIQ